MAEKSSIEWTESTWTPIRAHNLKTGKIGWHCEHATTGCEFCYAEGFNLRLGTGLPFKPGHRADIEIFLDEKMLTAPLRWKRPRKIFVGSMTDLFADFVTDEWLDKIFAIMAACPQHTFQVLTKRAARLPALPKLLSESCLPPILPNVWLGISCERQEEADERIPLLLDTPAVVRFISAEPLLGPINLTCITEACGRWFDAFASPDHCLDWVIVGGESGPHARPFDLAWAAQIVTQCHRADVPCFVKQLGSCPISDGYPLHLGTAKGGDPDEWPGDLRVRQFPDVVNEGDGIGAAWTANNANKTARPSP